VKGTYIIDISTAKIYVDSIWTVNYGMLQVLLYSAMGYSLFGQKFPYFSPFSFAHFYIPSEPEFSADSNAIHPFSM